MIRLKLDVDMPTPNDYDTHPERFRRGSRLTARTLRGATIHHRIAEILACYQSAAVLDIGCGEGALRAAVGVDWPRVVGLDASAAMLSHVPPPVVRAHATALPFADHSFDAAVAVNVLDHLPSPVHAIREARRVLRPNGVFIAAATSRRDSPELAHVWRPAPTPFDAEDAPAITASVFDDVDVERWDAPLIALPDQDAVAEYLIARFMPSADAATAAATVPTPITLTKRGALIIGRASPTVHSQQSDSTQDVDRLR